MPKLEIELKWRDDTDGEQADKTEEASAGAHRTTRPTTKILNLNRPKEPTVGSPRSPSTASGIGQPRTVNRHRSLHLTDDAPAVPDGYSRPEEVIRWVVAAYRRVDRTRASRTRRARLRRGPGRLAYQPECVGPVVK